MIVGSDGKLPPGIHHRAPLSADEKVRVREALATLAESDFGLTAEAVVQAARDPKSPLHALFDWDTKRAAERYWLIEARAIIVSFKYTMVTTTTTYQLPQYVRNPRAPADRQGYVSVDQMRTDTDLAHEHLLAEFARVRSALDRARGYAVTLGHEHEIDELIEQVVGIRSVFDQPAAA
jgi:hypothetical protein